MGGLWAVMPRMGGTGMLFAVATLGLPGLGNFVGEFLVLLGVYRANVAIAVLATLGFIVSTVYALWMMQRVFLGSNRLGWQLPDSTPRERGIMAAMIAVIVWLGLYPQTVLTSARPALQALQQSTAESLNRPPLVPIAEASHRQAEASQTGRPGSSDGDHP
jgi:NADH-quinone oxidoreductase subunit M